MFFRYVEEHVQKTGVAIETQGFTFVTSGRKRESLTVSKVRNSEVTIYVMFRFMPHQQFFSYVQSFTPNELKYSWHTYVY